MDAHASRRSFLRAAAASAAALASGCASASGRSSGSTASSTGASSSTAASSARVVGSNSALRVGVIGLHGRGQDHLAGLRKLADVRVTAICDVDGAVLDKQVAAADKLGEKPHAFRDPRALLDSGEVDAITVATPNHWHSLLGVWAAQRSLHSYVEKPVSHDVWEGAQLEAAAKKHRVVIACGTQCRSNPGMQQAIAWAKGGGLGRLRLARGLCYKPRGSIGKVKAPKQPPAGVDYDVWLGPAPQQLVRREHFHYDWHWQWDFGNGDLGNQGVHQMDLCRWAVGQDALPPQVLGIGGRLGYDDDGETPNTQVVWLGYEPAPVVFEVRGLPTARGSDKMDRFLGADVGCVLHCEHGYVVLNSYEGGYACDADGQRVQQWQAGGDHFANFVAAVRAADPSRLSADAHEGHLSAALCHLGNDSLRQGKALGANAAGASAAWQPELAEAWGRAREHLRANGLDDAVEVRYGALLRPAADGTKHPHRDYRAPFVLEPVA